MKARSFFDAGNAGNADDSGGAHDPEDDAATTDSYGSVPDTADTAEAMSDRGGTGSSDGNRRSVAAPHTGVVGAARMADKEAWLLDNPPPAPTRVRAGTPHRAPEPGEQRPSLQSPAAPRRQSKRVWLSRQPSSRGAPLGNRVVSADPVHDDFHDDFHDARQQSGAEGIMHHGAADPAAAHGPAIEVVEGADINHWPAHVVRDVRSTLQQVWREIGPRLRQEGERFAVLLVMLAAIVVLGMLWGGGTLLLRHGFARGGSAGSSGHQGGTAAGPTAPRASTVVPDATTPARTGTSTSAATATPAQAPGVKALKGSIVITNTSSVPYQNVVFVSTIGQFSPLWTCSNQPNSMWDVDLAPGASLMVTCLVVGSPLRALPATLAPHAFRTTEENADGTARVIVDNLDAFVPVTLS